MPKTVEINGSIEWYGYGSGYLGYFLRDLKNEEVTLKVTSLGGSVSEALKMKDQISEHGNVTVEYVGFNASAATLLGHAAKKTVIHEDAMYLIHKASVWVDAWGQMNEDDMEKTIESLKKDKKDLEAVTLMIANDYVNCRGMKIEDVKKLMQEARWLSAQEAVDLGLVDEIVSSCGKKKKSISNVELGIMNAAGLPIPSLSAETENTEENEPSWVSKLIDAFKGKKEDKQITNTEKTMNKTFVIMAALLAVDAFEEKDGKVTLTNEQMKKIEDALSSAKSEKEKADTEAKDSMAAVISQLDGIDASVKDCAEVKDKVAKVKELLDKKPAAEPFAPADEKADEDECATDLINKEIEEYI